MSMLKSLFIDENCNASSVRAPCEFANHRAGSQLKIKSPVRVVESRPGLSRVKSLSTHSISFILTFSCQFQESLGCTLCNICNSNLPLETLYCHFANINNIAIKFIFNNSGFLGDNTVSRHQGNFTIAIASLLLLILGVLLIFY